MTHTQQTDLERLIRRSILLTDERKRALLTVLPQLSESQSVELVRMLASEEKILQDFAKHAVERAVERGDTAFLKELDRFLAESAKNLRKSEERGERGDEEQDVESLFDAA